jgi:hypothetical protein
MASYCRATLVKLRTPHLIARIKPSENHANHKILNMKKIVLKRFVELAALLAVSLFLVNLVHPVFNANTAQHATH